jgi:hypothetical protein
MSNFVTSEINSAELPNDDSAIEVSGCDSFKNVLEDINREINSENSEF